MNSPQLIRSIYPLRDWLFAIRAEQQTPDETPIQRVRWIGEELDECLTYLHRVDDYKAGTRLAGRTPQFLGYGRNEGEAWFRLAAPCVVFTWHLTTHLRLRSEAILVVTHDQLPRSLATRLARPYAGLMQPREAWPNQPRRLRPSPLPNWTPEGSDPHGDC